METNDQVLKDLLQDKEETQSNETDGDNSASDQSNPQENLVTLHDGRKVMPSVAAEEYRKLQQELTKRTERIKELERASQTPPTDQGRLEQIKSELRGLGVVFSDEQQRQNEQLQAQIELKNKLDQTARDIDGSDGRPAFKQAEVIAYMQKLGLYTLNVKEIYEMMNADQLAKWRAEQILKVKSENRLPGSRGDSSGSPAINQTEEKSKARSWNRSTEREVREKIRSVLAKNDT